MDDSLKQINELIAGLKNKLLPNKPLMTSIAVHMHANVMHNIESQGQGIPGGWPKPMFGGKALLREGNLIRSIQAKATDNTSIVSTNRVGAWLMHHGGKIQAKKVLGSVKRKKNVWAMEQYFWSQWYKSGKKEKLYFILALHMQKHDSVTVPAYPFMVITEPYKNKIIQEIRTAAAR